MACIAGRLSRIQVSFDGGSTYNNLDGVVDATINIEVDELECTTHDSNGVREWIPNHQSATSDISMRWDETSAQQIGVLDSIFPSPASFKMQFDIEPGSTNKRFEADCFVTSYSVNTPLDDAAALDTTLRLSSLASVNQP